MPPPPTLRPAANNDAPAIRQLVFDILREHHLQPDPAGTDADLDDIQSTYHDSGGSFDLLISPPDRIIATVALLPLTTHTCELRKMYLHPDHRGRGLGRSLALHAIRRARQLRFTRIELETAANLTRAIALYQSLGFRPFNPHRLSPRCDQAYFLDLPPDRI